MLMTESTSIPKSSPVLETLATPHYTRPTFLMCPPQWYAVDYVINPWMAGNLHRPTRDGAFAQWNGLYQRLLQIADVKLLHPRQGAPDMVFVAHTALVQHGVAALSSFAHIERRVEEQHLRQWLEDAGFLLWETPHETAFEGEGDAAFDDDGNHLWIAHGVRTCRYSHEHVAAAWHARVTSLHLVDPRFYHLDTCFAPLTGGRAVYFPGAFDAASNAAIEAAYPADRRIAVSETEAIQFGCNILCVGNEAILHTVEGTLPRRLEQMGFRVTQLPLGEFVKGGGAAKSLALRLSDLAR